MSVSRLTPAIDSDMVSLPPEGRIAVFRPRAGHDLSALPKDRVDIIQGFRPDHDAWATRGYSVSPVAGGRYAMSVVMIPRAKAEARALLAEAAARTSGLVVVDGQKTDGIDSLLRECRKRVDPGEAFSKAHGKLFVFDAASVFGDWAVGPEPGPEGFVTAPGVFSADRVDHGSRLLGACLPEKLGPLVADLGAGWGYLSAQILKRPLVTKLHLVEAEYAALECARLNITDARARFHWADATDFRLETPVDTIVTNPPFHTTRAATPDLGRAFISAAAAQLAPRGTLWLVANRHLPYETALAAHFTEVEEAGGDSGFKVLTARRPRAASRTSR